MAAVRVRFSPSPTGSLHLGGVRTALYNYALARKHDGALVLRIDDTNPGKAVPGAVDKMLRIFNWLGIVFDEGPHVGGAHGPYVQSERQQFYQQTANELIKTGAAYHCFCSKERLQFLRSYRTGYDGHCRKLTNKQINDNLLTGTDHVIRLKVPTEGQISVNDGLHGNTVFECNTLDDQVLLKSNSTPTYHLATVVDDHMMQMSHVIRGEDLLPSTAKHVLLYNALNWTMPQFVHLPLLLSDTGKMSKRHDDVAIETYKEEGFLPDTIINYTALQGWSNGDGSSSSNNEVFNLQQFVDMFALSSLNKASCRLNRDKMEWLNKQHLLLQYQHNPEILINELRHQVTTTFPEISENDHRVSNTYLHNIIPLALEVTHAIPNVVKEVSYYWRAPSTVKLNDTAVIHSIVEHLDTLPEPHGEDDFSSMLNTIATTNNMSLGKVMKICRSVITGGKAGPRVVTLMNVMGKHLIKHRLSSQVVNT